MKVYASDVSGPSVLRAILIQKGSIGSMRQTHPLILRAGVMEEFQAVALYDSHRGRSLYDSAPNDRYRAEQQLHPASRAAKFEPPILEFKLIDNRLI